MSFDPPPTSAAQTPKRPHLSIFRFSSYRTQAPNTEPPAYSPHDVLAARYRRLASRLYWARLAISILTLVGGVVILACAANTLRSYSSTKVDSQFMLPIWPTSVDLRPTHAVLTCGIILTAFSLTYVLAALVPIGAKLHFLNLLSTPLSFLSLFMAIFATAYASTITNHLASSTSAGTLVSWTCKWKDFTTTAPASFGKICTESTVAISLVDFMIVAEVFAVLLSAFGWWVEARVKRTAGEKGSSGV